MRKRSCDNLDIDVRRAREAGMSYGRWKAAHPHTREENQESIRQANLSAAQRRKEEAERAKFKTCPVCGKQFLRSAKAKIYCSHECAIEAQKRTQAIYRRRCKKVKEEKSCLWCGKTFTPRSGAAKYCCKECRIKANIDMKRERRQRGETIY